MRHDRSDASTRVGAALEIDVAQIERATAPPALVLWGRGCEEIRRGGPLTVVDWAGAPVEETERELVDLGRLMVTGPDRFVVVRFLEPIVSPTAPPTTAPMIKMAPISMATLHLFLRYHGTGGCDEM